MPKKKGEASRFPFPLESGAGDESRTRDLNLGKVALYQLSYSRMRPAKDLNYTETFRSVKKFRAKLKKIPHLRYTSLALRLLQPEDRPQFG